VREFFSADCISAVIWPGSTQPSKKSTFGDLKYPLILDLSKAISRDYGVLLEQDGVALRGLFLIDREGIVRHTVVNDLPIGRSVDEALRVLDALQFYEEHGEVWPANWKPGVETIKLDPEGARVFLQAGQLMRNRMQ
jgi:alkyl hydroperoxide reductase subunit AhpC